MRAWVRRMLHCARMLRIRVTVGDDTFEFETSRPHDHVALAEVFNELDRWFAEIEKPDRIALQTARLNAKSDQLRAAVDASTPPPTP